MSFGSAIVILNEIGTGPPGWLDPYVSCAYLENGFPFYYTCGFGALG